MELEYDEIYYHRCRLRLNSGRSVILKELVQQYTYVGLLEGVPNAHCNDVELEWALRAAQRMDTSGKPHLIEPPRRDYRRTPGDMDSLRRQRPYLECEWLPPVRCIAEFQSGRVKRDDDLCLSSLVVVWYQDDYAPPILPPAADAILALDWDALATNFDPY